MTTSKKTDLYFDRIHRELDQESDRSVAIVAAALIDEALASLIERKLIPAEKNDFCIFSQINSPIGTFSSRINACYQLGLISLEMHKDLHFIRKIRNKFAHEPFDLTFENDAIRDWVLHLMRNSKYQDTDPNRENTGPEGSRYDFIFSVGWRLFALTETDIDVEKLPSKFPEFGYIKYEELPEDIRRLLENQT